jgi:diphosphomevalonate decarboxylase
MKPNWEVEPLISGSAFYRAFSPSNIALSKYWGKRDLNLNLPSNGSISISLKDFGSFTTVEFHSSFAKDRLILNGQEERAGQSDLAPPRVRAVLDALRAKSSGPKRYARVQSWNNFPTGAGLASSASGLGALAFAASHALGLAMADSKISEIARLGSGSACRSVLGGFVEWARGEFADGSDSIAYSLADIDHWDLRVFLAVVRSEAKEVLSTSGMEMTRASSPFFDAWVASAQLGLRDFRQAILERNFAKLAALSESNCVRMHACAMAAVPPIFYWTGKTVELMGRVQSLRSQGVPVFFTVDAGPNVVVVTLPEAASTVRAELAKDSSVRLLSTRVGAGARPFDPKEWME